MQLEGYREFKKIAEGGMAVLYQGQQSSLERPVAIKVLKRQMASEPQLRQRFDAESRIIARLDHPNIIRVIDRGVTDQGEAYFVMDFVAGVDLKKALAMNKLSIKGKFKIALQLANALAYAHKNGIVHCDMKPANVLIDMQGNARVVDFGIAQAIRGQHSQTDGAVMGTPAYMAPEQTSDNGKISHLCDIYSFGIMMYECFCGAKPGPQSLPVQQINPEVPASLSQLIMQCFEPDAKKRPQSAARLAAGFLHAIGGGHLKAKQHKAAEQVFNAKDKFVLLDVIKDDVSGAEYLFENRQDRSMLLVKKRSRDEKGYDENRLLSRLQHPNIGKILGASQNPRVFIVVTEYLAGGSLMSRMARPMEIKAFLPIAMQIIDGLVFAHKNHIVHGTLQPKNIIFSAKNHAKLVDFGFVEKQQTHQLSPYERELGVSSEAGDIYAAGVIFYQVLTAELPVMTRGKLLSNKAFKRLPKDLQQLIRDMLDYDERIQLSGYDVQQTLSNMATEDEEKTQVSWANRKRRVLPQQLALPSFKGRILFLLLLFFSLNLGAFWYLNPQQAQGWINQFFEMLASWMK